MSDASLLPDDEPVSFPSMPTMRGGDPATLGRIDHYDLLRKLGDGGFGVVYLARDTASGVEVAIKTLHPLLKHNAEEMELLREKFKLVSRLAHPNIATALVLHPVRDIGVYDEDARRDLKLSPGDSVMVMRYAPGVTLSRWRRQFPGGIVPFDRALEIGRQVAAALDYAHGEKIVHRDIKPSNVVVETVAAEPRPLDHGQGAARSPSSPTLRVRILDFGLASEIRSSMSRVSTEQGDTSGTRPYMAPEQWLGKKQDGRTDEYALACVLYELLSGAPPFAGVFETGDPAVMKSAVVGDAPEEIEGLPDFANAAFLRALSKSPKDRFPSCTAFVAALSSTTEHAEDTEGRDEATTRPQSAFGAPSSPGALHGEVENTATAGSSASAAIEADILSRKVDLSSLIADIPVNERNDPELAPHVAEARRQVSAAEEACRLAHFVAATTCLDRAEAALKIFVRTKERKNADAERAVREAADLAARKQRGFRRVSWILIALLVSMAGGVLFHRLERAAGQARARACLSNMRQIQTACELFLTEHGESSAAIASISDTGWITAVVGPTNYIKYPPECPEGGTYHVSVGDDSSVLVTCDNGIREHTLPEAVVNGRVGGTARAKKADVLPEQSVVSVAEVSAKSVGEYVTVAGALSEPSDLDGKGTAYMLADGTGTIQVFFWNASVPVDLQQKAAAAPRVRIRGKVKVYNGVLLISPLHASDVEIP